MALLSSYCGCTGKFDEVRQLYLDQISGLENLQAQVRENLAHLRAETEHLQRIEDTIRQQRDALDATFSEFEAKQARFQEKGTLLPIDAHQVADSCVIVKEVFTCTKEQIPLEELTVKEDFTYEKFLVKIFETAERITRSQIIKTCKVQWKRYTETEATWERKEDLRKTYS